MVIEATEEKNRLKKDRAKEAITFAMESKWGAAIDLNKLILADFPEDVETLNRLGKAYSEFGRYNDARDAFSKVLKLAPSNLIARKNLERVKLLNTQKPVKGAVQSQNPRVAPHFFIEETGKTGATTLIDTAASTLLARMSAGEIVELKVKGQTLYVHNASGEQLGRVEPRLALRLIGLMTGGNKYAAAVAGVDAKSIRIFIRETYQHPVQRGRLSFPARGSDDFKAYVWEGALRHADDDDDSVTAEAEVLPEESDEEEEVVRTPSSGRRARRTVPDDGIEEEESF